MTTVVRPAVAREAGVLGPVVDLDGMLRRFDEVPAPAPVPPAGRRTPSPRPPRSSP